MSWENMRTFYQSSNLWPTDITSRIEGSSPLIVTMFHLPPKTQRLQTYAWKTNPAETLWTDCETDPATADPMTASSPTLSQAKWANRQGLVPAIRPPKANNPPIYTGRPLAVERPQGQLSSANPRKIQNPSTTRQKWEQMRLFFSSQPKWPTADQQTSEGSDGGSPLVWTTLSPISASARLQTYAWDGHLANLLPWTSGQPDSTRVRPPLISYALWNIRRDEEVPTTSTSADKQKSTDSVPKSQENPTPSPIKAPKQHARPKVFVPVTESQQVETSKKAQCQPRPICIMGKTIYSIMVALLFPIRTGNPQGPGIDTQHETSPPAQGTHQYNPLPTVLKPDMSHISNHRRTIALLQLHWNTAWDLMTHRNVETA